MSTSRLTFRPDLQGLRAIAVIAVLLFHVWPKLFRGGFVGVDVFFVISGYLITGLLLAEIDQTGRLDLLRFWGRRMMRLLPAATVVLLVALCGALIWLPRTDWIKTAHHVLSSALYFENWSLVAESVDYWAQGQSPSPVQHYWSLSIEEQFYIFWPPIIALTAFFGALGKGNVRTMAMVFIGVIFVGSLSYSIVPISGAGAAYFKTTTRAWELALGAFIAAAGNRFELPAWQRSTLGWIGLTAVAASILLINEKMRFPGWVALFPTIGTALLLISGNAPWSPYRLLALKPAQYIGDISYSLYLWHWPLIVFFRPLEQEVSQGYTPYVILAITLSLAALTKYFVEDPFRTGRFSFHLRAKSRWQFIRNAFATALAMIAVTAGISGAVQLTQQKIQDAMLKELFESAPSDIKYPGAAAFDPKYPAKVPPGVPLKPNPSIAEWDMRYRYRDCMNRGRVCEFGDAQGKMTVALVGDSHAMHYAPALEAIAKKQGWKLLVMVKVACMIGDFPLYSEGKYRGDCEGWRIRMLKWVAEAKPEFVITSSGRTGVYGGLPSEEKQIKGYRDTFSKFLAHDTRIVVIHDNPLMLHRNKGSWLDIPKCLAYNGVSNPICFKSRNVTLDTLPDVLMTSAAGIAGVGTMDLTQYLCTKDQCPPIIGNVLVYRDAHHLTETFVNTLTPYLEKELLRVMKTLPSARAVRKE